MWVCLCPCCSLDEGSTFTAHLLMGSTCRMLVPTTELPRSENWTFGSRGSRNNFPQTCPCGRWVQPTSCCTSQILPRCVAVLDVISARLVVHWAQSAADLRLFPPSQWGIVLSEQREEGAKSQGGSGVPCSADAGVDFPKPSQVPLVQQLSLCSSVSAL